MYNSNEKHPLDDLDYNHLRTLQLLRTGHANKEISGILKVSIQTVTSLVARLRMRFGCITRGRLELIDRSNKWV